jgi:Tat protein translocase TatB subunit
MFGISFFELCLIFVICLIVFGPEKLPEIARFIGKFTADLKKTSDSVRREFYNTVYKPLDDVTHSVKRELTSLPTLSETSTDSSKDLNNSKHNNTQKESSDHPENDTLKDPEKKKEEDK